ncbi:hypothetical protein TNCV_4398451 [Trichonephila clavipes]|nr:hypothetical protein TNCV_4398451 [Trichonephila clavipes]
MPGILMTVVALWSGSRNRTRRCRVTPLIPDAIEDAPCREGLMYVKSVMTQCPHNGGVWKKCGDSYPSYEDDDLNEYMIVFDNKEIKGEFRILRADLIHEGLKFATSMEQPLITHDPEIKSASKFQRNIV